LIGCVFFGDPFHRAKEWSYENEIGKLWTRFMSLTKKYSSLLQRISSDPFTGYELHLEPEEFRKTNQYYVMVGLEARDFDQIPLEFFSKNLPKTDFLEFTTQMAKRKTQGSYIFQKWMPEHKIKQRYPFIIQRYDSKRYRGLDDPSSEIDWLIPIQNKLEESDNNE
jgi:AraC family transcriptional regulator